MSVIDSIQGFRDDIAKGDYTYTEIFTNVGPFAALALLIVLFTFLSEDFLTYQNLVQNIMSNSAVLLLVAIAGTFPILQQSIDLSVAQIVTLTGVSTALLVPTLGLVVIPVVILIGTFVGVLNGVIFTKLKIPSFLVTLGMLEVLHGTSLLLTGGSSVSYLHEGLVQIAIGQWIPYVPNLVLWSLLLYGIAVFLAWRTKFGRYIYAIGENERVVDLSGVKVTRYKIMSFALSGTFCGIAGLLLAARISSASGAMGSGFLIPSIAAIVMGGTSLSGGVGGPHRTILGVLVIQVLDNGMGLIGVHPFTQQVILGIVVIIAVALSLDRRKIDFVK